MNNSLTIQRAEQQQKAITKSVEIFQLGFRNSFIRIFCFFLLETEKMALTRKNLKSLKCILNNSEAFMFNFQNNGIQDVSNIQKL